MLLSIPELGAGVLIGTLLGYVASKIIPIEYKMQRTANKESKKEVDEWYEKAIKDTNNLILSCLRLQQLLRDRELLKNDILESDEYKDVDNGVDQLVSHMWGAPEQIKKELRLPTVQEVLNLMTASGTMPGNHTDDEYFRDRLDREMDRISSRCFDFLEKIEENTNRYTTEQLEELQEKIQDTGDISYEDPSLENFNQ